MADLPESTDWAPGVYQVETSDPVLGGPEGTSNQQARQLANRTKWLKDQIAKIVDGTVAIGKAAQLKTARTLEFKGAATGSGTYDGSVDTDIMLTLSDFDWDKITSGKPTTLEGYGITDAAPLFSPALEGAPTAPKAPRFDVSDQVMTAAAVHARGFQYSGFYSVSGAVPGNVSHVGGIVHFTGAGFPSYSLPDSAAHNIPPGSAIRLHNWSVTNLALAVQGADKAQENNDTASSAATRSIPPDTYVDCLYIGSGVWMLMGTGVAGKTRQFGALLAPNGYQRLPSGLLMQWMTANFASAFKGAAFNLPAAFPNQFFGCSVSLTDSAIYDSTGQPFVAGMPNGLGQVLLQSNYTASQSAVRVLAFGI